MSCNWSLVKLTDVACIITKKIDANQITKDCYISTENMQPYKRGVSSAGSLPSAAKFNSFRSGDTLFSNIRTYFEKVWLASFSGGASADVLIFRTKDESVLLSEYLYHFLSSPEFIEFTVRTSKGAKMPRGDKGAMMDFEFKLPPVEIQKIIACSLQGLERKVLLNSQTNQTLEQMAQAIFKSWFVDFDPVKAKMNGEQPEGMDAVTASLFPEKLVESELGLIPEGWSIQTIKALSEKISKGTTPSKKDLASATDEPSIRFIKVKDINDQGEILRDKLEAIPDSIHRSKLKRSILEKEDILFSIAGTIGRVAIVDQDLDNVNTNQAVAFVRLKDKQTYLPLVYMAMRENRLQQKAISSIVQGVQANLSLANVGDMEVIVPSEDILNLWNTQYSSMLQMIKSNFSQSRQLAALRDTLLPKLLSGEIELKASA